MEKKEKAAKVPYVHPKVYKVNYLIRGVPKEDRTPFDGPEAVRHGVANVLVENELQLAGVVARIAGLSAGETSEVTSTQVLADHVHTVAAGYDKESTGVEPPKGKAKVAKKAAKKPKAKPAKKAKVEPKKAPPAKE